MSVTNLCIYLLLYRYNVRVHTHTYHVRAIN